MYRTILYFQLLKGSLKLRGSVLLMSTVCYVSSCENLVQVFLLQQPMSDFSQHSPDVHLIVLFLLAVQDSWSGYHPRGP